jgi:hypothetical protein
MDEISAGKVKLIEALLDVYGKEVEAIFAVDAAWDQLKDEAKSKCVEDFDQAIIARETLLEELGELRDAGIKPEMYEFSLYSIDQHLLQQHVVVNELYGMDVNSFLNVKKPKALLKAKK